MRFNQVLSVVAAVGILISAGTATATYNQTWVPFRSGNQPATPQITLLESNDSYVTYRIVTPGMWVTDVTGTDYLTYQKIELHRELNETTIGYPMLPRVPVNLAIPTGATVSVTVTQVSSLTLSNYKVAPYPTSSVSYDHGMAIWTDSYTKNASIYQLTTTYPSSNYLTRDYGMFRNQQAVGVDIYTIRCKPALNKLVVADTVKVKVTFNGGGAAEQDLGIFNEAANACLINHYWPRYEPPEPPAGTATLVNADVWENDWDLHPCDYLIVVPNQEFLNSEPGFMGDVMSFAAMRASLSGFDVHLLENFLFR